MKTNYTQLLQAAGCTAYEIKKFLEYIADKAGADKKTRQVGRATNAKLQNFLKEQEDAEKQMKYFTLDQVLDNPEIPVNIQLDVLEINEANLTAGLNPITGVGLEPNFKGDKKLTWWVWDNGQNRRWFNKNGELATPVKGNQKYYYTAVRTYINRLRRDLPFYG